MDGIIESQAHSTPPLVFENLQEVSFGEEMTYEEPQSGFNLFENQPIDTIKIETACKNCLTKLQHSDLSKLKHIHVSEIENIHPEEFVGMLFNTSTEIQTCDIKGINLSNVSTQLMKMLIKNCPKLKTVHIKSSEHNIVQLCEYLKEYTQLETLV